MENKRSRENYLAYSLLYSFPERFKGDEQQIEAALTRYISGLNQDEIDTLEKALWEDDDTTVLEIISDWDWERYMENMTEAKIGQVDPFKKHQIKIAKSTLKLSDAGAKIMGGMAKPEARDFLKSQGWSENEIAKLEEAKVEYGENTMGKVNETVVKKVSYRGYTIKVEGVYSKRFGQLYRVSNDTGEPTMTDYAYKTVEKALAAGEKDVDDYVRDTEDTKKSEMDESKKITEMSFWSRKAKTDKQEYAIADLERTLMRLGYTIASSTEGGWRSRSGNLEFTLEGRKGTYPSMVSVDEGGIVTIGKKHPDAHSANDVRDAIETYLKRNESKSVNEAEEDEIPDIEQPDKTEPKEEDTEDKGEAPDTKEGEAEAPETSDEESLSEEELEVFNQAVHIPGGRADGMEDEDFDPEALARGIEIEYEHTDNPDLALDIAKDHLAEFDGYYDALDKMEAELAKEEGKEVDHKAPEETKGEEEEITQPGIAGEESMTPPEEPEEEEEEEEELEESKKVNEGNPSARMKCNKCGRFMYKGQFYDRHECIHCGEERNVSEVEWDTDTKKWVPVDESIINEEAKWSGSAGIRRFELLLNRLEQSKYHKQITSIITDGYRNGEGPFGFLKCTGDNSGWHGLSNFIGLLENIVSVLPELEKQENLSPEDIRQRLSKIDIGKEACLSNEDELGIKNAKPKEPYYPTPEERADKQKETARWQFHKDSGYTKYPSESIIPDYEKDSEETQIKKLTEVKLTFDKHEFSVDLVEENENDVTININGKQDFNFTNEFTQMFRDEAGKITDEGLRELAQSALSNLSEEYFDQLASTGEETPETPEEEPVDEPMENTSESKINEGLESEINSYLEKKGIINGEDFGWEDGELIVFHSKKGNTIAQLLNKSRKFTRAHYDSKVHVILFESKSCGMTKSKKMKKPIKKAAESVIPDYEKDSEETQIKKLTEQDTFDMMMDHLNN